MPGRGEFPSSARRGILRNHSYEVLYLIGADNEPLQVLFPKLCGEFFSSLKTGLMTDTDAVKCLVGSKALDRNARVFRFQSSFQVLGCTLTFKRANLNCKGRSRCGRRSWGFKGLLT